ncbi:hypothetical protein Pam5_66 [Pseudanabaena phage Pam5]|nr:hypothetical protein Pam5_66 [Pseudanabaena phage Pam5]
MSEWQPIETAPKDMSSIIAFIPGLKHSGIQEEFDEVAVVFWKREGWVYQHDDHLYATPSHWLPIPPNPA